MDIICYSHLRWNFVYQRPQHLFGRFAKQFRVFFIEEPVFGSEKPFIENNLSREGVWVVVPHLPDGMKETEAVQAQRDLLQEFFAFYRISRYIFWYTTPMALPITDSFSPILTVYDCMDELSAFKNPPPRLKELESKLFKKADLVFTGGHTLYEAKKGQHPCIYPFPSSIDKKHFEKSRAITLEPADQFVIPTPRIGFFGVIDERMDLDLLETIARERPEWNFVIIGPVVKIDPSTLPVLPNIHYLGSKSYEELPTYLAGWDVAMMPFAINESTKFISPTKTPEYLAGGKPVVSTPIKDVVTPYGDNGLVYIAGSAEEFIKGIDQELNMPDKDKWLKAVDAFLEKNSWEKTVEKMLYHINTKIESNQHDNLIQKENEYV
jgi:glycosyltransferase involved in cell wall biosynthesis